MVEEVPNDVLLDVDSSQLGLRRSHDGEFDGDLVCHVCDPKWLGGHLIGRGSLGVLVRRLVIVMEEGPSALGSDQPIVYWGAYERVRGVVSSWTEDGDMVYNHYCCLRGPMLLSGRINAKNLT